MITRQCATMLDAILVEHVSAHAVTGIIITTGAWAVITIYTMLLQCMYNNDKRAVTSLHKKISKKKSS